MDNWRIVKLFELELSNRKIAIQLEQPCQTVWKAVKIFQYAFWHADFDGHWKPRPWSCMQSSCFGNIDA